ncbi:MAG: bifunctional folylpolyglutamate synthase/dihydrofolate synthase, partial [Clostridiales bacterium]|nr:bifunctional folylpolyglutamate synthase/dihydrofolate synthase [Clostridiales bacterium]
CSEKNASVVFAKKKEIAISLLGGHQLNNAAVAIDAIKVLRKKGWMVSDDAIKNGFEKTKWAGRFEIISNNPTFIIDAAHNPQGIQAAINTLQKIYPGRKYIFIFGVLADKDYQKMAELLAPHAKKFILVTPGNPRALPASELAKFLKHDNIVSDSIKHGIELARQTAQPDDIICALGSLKTIGKIRGILNE